MAPLYALLSHCSVLAHHNCNPMLSFPYPKSAGAVTFAIVSKWVPKSKTESLPMRCVQPTYFMSRGGSDDRFNFAEPDPFWLYYFKETIRAFKLLFDFLIQQPGQLKYIEWPSFLDTLHTATLTLLLVAILIISLSSIDSVLSFVLVLLLRRPA